MNDMPTDGAAILFYAVGIGLAVWFTYAMVMACIEDWARRQRRRRWAVRQANRYGDVHQAERAKWVARVAEFGSVCTERVCIYPTRRIEKGAPFHLAHDHLGGGDQEYLGPAHPECNLYEAHIRLGRPGPPPTAPVKARPKAPQAPPPAIRRTLSQTTPARETVDTDLCQPTRPMPPSPPNETGDVSRGPARIDSVVRVWESTTGSRLTDSRRAEFVGRPEAEELAECTEQVLEAAAKLTYRKHGELRLNRWLAMVPVARLTLRDMSGVFHGVRTVSDMSKYDEAF